MANSMQPVINFLESRTGIVFSPTHLQQVLLSVGEFMGDLSATDLVEKLKQDKVQLDQLIAKVTINETYFFRDNNHFDLVRDRLIPDFIQNNGLTGQFKMWSAGCSSGEEAYSLAMLMSELGMLNRCKIIGTDIDTVALEKAKRAQYGEWSFRNTNANLRRYFKNDKNVWHLNKEIREKVIFEQLNLSENSYPSFARGLYDLDLIMCRNVLIYFDTATIKKTANRMYQSLSDTGVLICGPSDPSLVDLAPFNLVIEEGMSYYTKKPQIASSKISASKINKFNKINNLIQQQGEYKRDVLPKKPTIIKPTTNVRPKVKVDNSALPAISKLDAVILEAEEALGKGQYQRAISLTEAHTSDPKALLLYIKATASATGSNSALEKLKKHQKEVLLSLELNYLTAILQIDCGQLADAQAALSKTLYLDPSLAIGHFTLAVLQKRRGDISAAKKSLRNTIDICSKLDKTAILELSDGESAGRILELAKRELVSLNEG